MLPEMDMLLSIGRPANIASALNQRKRRKYARHSPSGKYAKQLKKR